MMSNSQVNEKNLQSIKQRLYDVAKIFSLIEYIKNHITEMPQAGT